MKDIMGFMEKEPMILDVAGKTREVLIEYKRNKNMWLRVNEDGSLHITCSRYVSQKQIREFILSKEKWIMKAEASVTKRNESTACGDDGNDAMWMGKRLAVRAVHDTRDYLEVDDHYLTFHLRNDTPETRKHVFYTYGSRHIVSLLKQKRGWLDESVCRANGKPLPKITVKYMTSRWGSCTPAKAHISISMRLIHYPEKCLDYVLLHEYAHMLEANHSKNFWHQVEIRMPEYKEYVKILKE